MKISRSLTSKASCVILTGLTILSSCGQKLGQVDESQEQEVTSQEKQEQIDIYVSLVDQTDHSALSLANATAYSISMDSCASGLTASITEANAALRVFKFDTGCLAKLTSFTVNGIDYVPTGADPFSTYQVGDTATFEDATDPAVVIQVSIAATLSSPVQVSDTVQYNFSELLDGADENIGNSVVSDDHTISVGGATAPNFNIAAVRFVGMSGAGAGEFEFDLECGAALIGIRWITY